LARHGAKQSMRWRGKRYYNALLDTTYAESIWSRFKAELLDGDYFLGLVEARLEIRHYIAHHNAERRYSALPLTSKLNSN
jgi:putative transposase